MNFVISREMMPALKNLYRRGGKFQRAANTVYEIIGRITSGDPKPMSGVGTTNYGEKRLKSCVKYDLAGACRLVTVQTEGHSFLLYAGDHSDVDSWLERNRGKEFCTDDRNRLVEVSCPSEVIEETSQAKIQREFGGESFLIERLPQQLQDQVLENFSGTVGSAVAKLSAFSTDDDIFAVAQTVPDSQQGDFLLDVLLSLIEGNIEQASDRIRLFNGALKTLDSDTEAESGARLQVMPSDSPQWAQLFGHFLRTADYRDWMLFLHPDQAQIVDQDFSGTAKLLGVSGSGKTCVVVKRAVRLASQNPNAKILILTLNRALSELIKDLVDTASPEGDRSKIEVMPFFELCQGLIYGFEPGSEKYYSDVTWKSEEHIDAIWREYYRCDLNNDDASVMNAVHDILISQDIDAEAYIRDEFDWIRSAMPGNARDEYLELERTGRSIPLQKQNRRQLLWGLKSWEEKMRSIGVIDSLGLVSALQPYIKKIEPTYDHILVDESQDFGTSELEIVRNLVPLRENDLFLCGDAAQRISPKHQKYGAAGISIPGARSYRLEKNYRNSKEILLAAYEVFSRNFNDFHLQGSEFEILDPVFADHHGPVPLLLSASSLEQELQFAISFANQELKANPSWKAVIAIAGHSLFETQCFGAANDYPVLDGARSIDEHSLYFSDLAQTKGFEFDLVIVVNAVSGVLPAESQPELEQARDLSNLYVAMTRAKSQLIVSYHATPSVLITGLDDVLLEDRWANQLDTTTVRTISLPKKLDAMEFDTTIPADLRDLTGSQLLYREEARGLSPRLIEAIRQKIGPSEVAAYHLTLAVNVGFACKKLTEEPKARRAFGPSLAVEFLDFCKKYGI